MSHSQFHSINCLYLDMHGLIFETSVWLLAESTRLPASVRENTCFIRPDPRLGSRGNEDVILHTTSGGHSINGDFHQYFTSLWQTKPLITPSLDERRQLSSKCQTPLVISLDSRVSQISLTTCYWGADGLNLKQLKKSEGLQNRDPLCITSGRALSNLTGMCEGWPSRVCDADSCM